MANRVQGDAAAERAVLAGICRFGIDALVDVSDLIDVDTFSVESNQIIFRCLEAVLTKSTTVDIPSIISAASELGLQDFVNQKEELEFISAIFKFPIKLENVRVLAVKIKKLEIAKKLQTKVEEVHRSLSEVSGNESIDEILSLAETPILDLSNDLNKNSDTRPKKLFSGASEYLDHLKENKCDMIGIPTGFPIYDECIGGGLRAGSVNLWVARPKTGKEQPLDSLVATPHGFMKMGDISVGSKVCTPFSSLGIANVDGVYPQGLKDVYKITFSDGDEVECGLEHLWYVKHCKKKDYETLTLKQIMDLGIHKRDGKGKTRPKWQLPLPMPVHFGKKSLKIDPYVMGCLLGDGSFRGGSVTFTNIDDEIIDHINMRLVSGYKLNQKSDTITYTLTQGLTGGKANHYIDTVRYYGLWNKTSHDKFIPFEYKNSTVEDRMFLLAGLLDTDGSVDKKGNVEYSTVSIQLANDVKYVVQSLGGLCTITPRTTTCNNKEFDSYRLIVKFNNPSRLFLLQRKINRCKIRTKPPLKRTIADITYVGKKECQCIHVDDNHHLYMTNDFVVTHNTTGAKEIAMHIAGPLVNIPVLMLDTEMSEFDQINRSISSKTKILTKSIETGKFSDNPEEWDKAQKFIKENEDIPYFYKGIAGKPFDEILSIIRRWQAFEVGYDENGKSKPCVVIYDYFKLMEENSLANMQEYQAMGFQISKLTDYATLNGISCLAFVQANRSGITQDSTDIISQSDRLLWLCGSATFLRRKTAEEIVAEGVKNGNMKLIPLECRYGPGLDNDFINMRMVGDFSELTELTTQRQAMKQAISGSIELDVVDADDEDDDNEVPFSD